MYRERTRRIVSMVLCMAMLLGNIPAVSFSAETDGLCEHHTEHLECGYVAGSTGAPCAHAHTEACYAPVTVCVHSHMDCGYVAAVAEMPCGHTHDGDCGYVEAVAGVACACIAAEDGTLTHEEGCGYVAPVEGVACGYVHGDCGYVAAVAEIPCGHVHDEECGYAEAVAGTACACVAAEDGTLTHEEGCGYVAPVEGVACGHIHGVCSHVCSEETGCVKTEFSCKHSHDEICGYAEVVEAAPCAFECADCTAALEETTEPATEPVTEPATEPVTEPATEPATELTTKSVMAIAEGNLGSGTPDGLPPVLNSITLSVTTVKAPGTIEVTLDATDDVSGAEYAIIWFYCPETNKSLHCSLSATYRDQETWENVPYADGKLHGKLEIDQYVVSGTFVLESIDLEDVAENRAFYHREDDYIENDDPFYPKMPDSVKNLQFTVTDEEMPDSKPPVLNGITLSVTTVKAPGTIEVTMDATDDVSGAEYADIWFYCPETNKDLYCYLSATYRDQETWENVPYADGKLHGKLEIDQYVVSGTFVLESIELQDVAENRAFYHRENDYNDNNDPFYPVNDPFYPVMPESVKNLQFTVTQSNTPDGMPPVLKDIKLAVDTMAAPGVIDITVDATDDVSGAEYASIGFYCPETNKSLHCSLSATYRDQETWENVPYADGKLHGKLEIDQYVVSGTFVVDNITLRDVAENRARYDREDHYNENDDPFYPKMPENIKKLKFNVLNAVPDVTTSVTKPEFVEQVEQAKDDAYIVADFSGNTTMPEETFDAIAGTNKTLDLVSEGVTWRFNGEDIVNEAKPIDLNVQITKAEEETSASGQEIQEKLDETPAVVMKFAENGQLPGKATIQVKVDYAMREYLGTSQKLCVYYYNNQTGKLELVAKDLSVVNDSYVEFSITHCSYYVLTTEIKEKLDSGSCGTDATWTVYSDNSMVISGAGYVDSSPWRTNYSTVTSVVVEDGITGLPMHAFFDMTKLESVKLSNQMTYIPGYCFGNAKALKSVTIPDSVTSIGEYAFMNCMGFTEFIIPDQVTLDLAKAFVGCENLRKLVIGRSVQLPYLSSEWDFERLNSLQEFVVAADNPNVKSVDGVLYTKDGKTLIKYPSGKHGGFTIPEGVVTINSWAFYGAPNLTELHISASVREITSNNFGSLLIYNTSGLHTITVDEKNENYASYDSVLYNKAKTTVMCCGPAKEGLVEIAPNAWQIGARAFANCSKITSVSIPETVEYIDSCAFEGCTSLKGLIIPPAVTQWGQYAFNECTSLQWIAFGVKNEYCYEDFGSCYSLADVYYYGSEEDWNTITISQYDWALTNAAKHYHAVLPGTYQVQYELNGGTNNAENPVSYHNYSDPIPLADPVREGYIFDGWYSDETFTEPTTVIQILRGAETADKHYYAKWSEGGNRIEMESGELGTNTTVWVNGTSYPVVQNGDKSYILLPQDVEIEAGASMVSYDFHTGDPNDIHTQYPTNMKVWILKKDEQGNVKPTHVEELDNILQYSGSSIRITGNKGIRMITSVNQDKKKALTDAGLADYKLVEYGTALCWASDLDGGKPMTLGNSYVKSNYAYKRGVADPVFAYAGDLVQYTNVLVGFTLDQCKDDIAMRPYMILEGPEGEQVTIYGGIVYRSIGYIAYQNRNVFQPKTASYNYVWEIIHHVYGDKYDADYKG